MKAEGRSQKAEVRKIKFSFRCEVNSTFTSAFCLLPSAFGLAEEVGFEPTGFHRPPSNFQQVARSTIPLCPSAVRVGVGRGRRKLCDVVLLRLRVEVLTLFLERRAFVV